MTQDFQSDRPARLAAAELHHHWRDLKEQLSLPGSMTAPEQMYFLGAPLAHVVAYEDHLKARRMRAPRSRGVRSGRLFEGLPRALATRPVVESGCNRPCAR